LKENVENADNTTKAEIYWTLASLGEKLAVYDIKD
jgi:hypothetical protein